MEARHRELVVRRLALALAVTLSCAAASPSAAQDGVAAGSLDIQGVRVSLRYAYASAQPGFFDKTHEDIRLVLTDAPIDASALADPFVLIDLARDGRLHAVEVVVDADRTPISGALYDRAFDGMISAAGMHVFEPTVFEHARVAGRLHTRDTSTFRGVTFSYDATFAAAIPRPPSPDEIARRLITPPAAAAARYLAALRDGNMERFRGMLAPPLAERFAGADADAKLSTLRAETPPDSRVVDVHQDGTTATATVNGTRDGIVIEFELGLVERAGVWKVIRTE